MRKRIMCGVALLICCLTASPVSAQDPITSFVLGGLEQKVNDALEKAKAASDALIRLMAEQALAVIKAWKESNKELLNTAFDRLDNTSKNVFHEMDKTFTRFETDETIVMHHAVQLSANWIDFVKDLPFTNHNPEVFLYYPRVIRQLPTGDGVPIHIIGPKLASADPSLSQSGTTTAKLDKAAESELIGNVERSKLTFNNSSSNLDRASRTPNREPSL
jgi:hypothetical protein